MKKLLYLLTAVVMFTCVSSGFDSIKKHEVEVEERFKPYYKRLTEIYKRNNIKFNYRKISKVVHIDSLPDRYVYNKDSILILDTKTYEGIYNRISKIIYINPSQMDAYWAGKYEEMLTVILAHEMAHSQGKEHSSDYCSLMYHNSTYSIFLITNYSVEELVVAIYKEDYPLLEEE